MCFRRVEFIFVHYCTTEHTKSIIVLCDKITDSGNSRNRNFKTKDCDFVSFYNQLASQSAYRRSVVVRSTNQK